MSEFEGLTIPYMGCLVRKRRCTRLQCSTWRLRQSPPPQRPSRDQPSRNSTSFRSFSHTPPVIADRSASLILANPQRKTLGRVTPQTKAYREKRPGVPSPSRVPSARHNPESACWKQQVQCIRQLQWALRDSWSVQGRVSCILVLCYVWPLPCEAM